MTKDAPRSELEKWAPEGWAVPDLTSMEGKLRRAEHHLETLRAEIGPLERPGAHTYSVEHDADAREYIFKAHGIAEAKPEWGYIVGDCLHNLRCALDHLILQLAVLGQGGRHLTESEVGSCAFPVFSKADEFRQRGEGRIRLLRSGEQARIREIQPFNARDRSIWGSESTQFPGRQFPARLPGLLHEISLLNNIDKHRGVHVAWAGVTWYDPPEIPDPFSGGVTAASLEGDAKVGSWSYPDSAPKLPPNMDVERYFPVRVSIGNWPGLYGYAVLDLLSWCIQAVEMIIGWFEPCFQRGDPVLPREDLDVPFGLWEEINWLKSEQ